MSANDGQQRSGACDQPGGQTAPASKGAVPNHPRPAKEGAVVINAPTFPTGHTGTHK